MTAAPDTPPRYQLDDLTLDVSQRRLWRGAVPLALSKLSFDLLRILVEAAPRAVPHDELVAKGWGPRRIVTPENLARRMLLLRQSLGDQASSPRYVAGVRGYGYRLVPAVRTLGAAVDADVAAAGAPAGAEPGSLDVPRGVLAAPPRRRAFGRMAAAAIAAVAVAWIAAEHRASEPVVATGTAKSIAVLPFLDLSETRDQAYLGEGFAEDLSSILTKIPQLRVTARGSAFAFRDKNLSTAEIARTLGVDYVLEGSVRRDGDQLRIGAQLVAAATDTQLWSATYPGSMAELFRAQQEIATRVAEGLRVTLLRPLAPVDTTRPEVYALYDEAQRILRDGNIPALPEARALLERAVELDPAYLPVRLALAFAYGDLPLSGAVDWPTGHALVNKTLEDAAQIWPDRAEVNSARATFALLLDGDLPTAGHYFERAAAIDPTNITVLSAAVPYALALGRPAAAVDMGEYVVARDPLCTPCRWQLLRAYLMAGRHSDVEALYFKSRALNLTTFGGFTYLYADSLLQSGRFDDALAAYNAIDARGDIGLQAARLTGVAASLYAMGRPNESDAAFAELRALIGANGWINIAAVHAYRGEWDAALEVLLAAPSVAPGVFDGPPLTQLRMHRRWPELAAKAGIWPSDPRAAIPFTITVAD